MAVYLVDDYYNVVSGTTPFMAASSNTPVVQVDFPNDANIQGRGMHPAPYQRSLEAGATTFSVIPVTRNQTAGLSVQVTDAKLYLGTAYSTDTVTGIMVGPAPAATMLILVPTEVASEGAPGGKTGTAGPLVAGSTYTITVRAVDAYGNLTTDGRSVRVVSNDIYAVHPPAQPMANGEAIINGFVPSAATNNMVIQALDDDTLPTKLSSATDSGVVVTPGAASRLMLLLPTQYLVPGKVTPPYGAAGDISTQTAGVPFNAYVYAADTRYNRVYGINKANIVATSDDAFAANLGSFNMTDGSATIGNITLRSAGFRTVTATDLSGTGTNLGATSSGVFALSPNNPTKLRAMVPNETRVPGSTGNGRAGVVAGQQAGFPFTVTVDIADAFWNLTPGTSQEIRLVCDDPFSVVSPSTQVVVGSATFTVTPKRAGATYVRAELVNAVPPWGPTLNVDTATVVSVAPGVPSRLLLVLPGEDFDQGSATGKAGVATEQKAGASFGVKVGVVDSFYNKVTGRPADVRVNTPSDAYAPAVSTAAINIASGVTDFIYVSMRKAATHYLTAADYGSSGLSSDPQSSTFTVRPADPVGLQLLVPGETAVPGSGAYPAGGKASLISTATAGTPFSVTINLVDQYMNRYTGLSVGPTVYLITSDIYDNDGSSTALNYGTLQTQLNLVTRRSDASIKVYPVAAADNNMCFGGAGGVCLGNDAAARAYLKVFSSTATRLEVVLPGQGLAEGKCNIGPCRDPLIAWPGRTGPPAVHTIGAGPLFASVYLTDDFYNKATELAGAAQDTNPVAVMPAVVVSMPGDFKTTPPGVQTLSNGSAVFAIDARTSFSTYTVVAATTAASAAYYAAGVSTLTVNPGPVTHMVYVLPSTTVVAGLPFSAALLAKDTFENNCSTGNNVYLGTAAFVLVDQVNPNQDPTPSAWTVPFYRSDLGVKDLPGWFTFRKAGVNTLGAYDTLLPGINVAPPAEVYVQPGPPNIYRVMPNADTEVGAGSTVLPGRQALTAQLSDAFDNNISSAGVPAYVEIPEVYGSTGALQANIASAWFDMGTSTIVYTDATGQVGVSTQMVYKVSSKAGDWARVWIGTTSAPVNTSPAYAAYLSARQNVTGKMTTKGGVPSKLLFVSSQAAAAAGIQEVAGAGAFFTVERRDDFDNLTREGQTDVFLGLPSAQGTIHTALGRTLGTFGTLGDYGYRDQGNTQFVQTVSIPPNQTQISFRYHDRTSSYSGLSPALNTGEGGRPGYWQIEARSGSMQPAIHPLRLNPVDIAKVSFGNQPVSLVAGRITDSFGLVRNFEAELRDMFDNPSLATATVRVVLSTFTRQPSQVNDAFSFSASSSLAAAFPPVFASTATFLDIPLDAYFATFYYLDTTASAVYGSTIPLRPVIKIAAPDRPAWSASTQPVHVLPDFTYRVNVSLNAGQTVMAGTTSQMFAMAIEDRYGNPTPIASGQEDAIGAGVLFKLESGSTGDVRFSAPSVSSFTAQPGYAKLALGESATSFYLIDTLLSNPTHQLTINTVNSKGWLPAISSYTVVPAPPDHVVFHTPSRRLVAGTTLQYADFALNLTTPTVVSVVLKDRYGNATSTSSAATVRFTAVRNSMYGGIDPSEAVLASNPNWKLLKTNPLDVPIFPGQSYANVYIWDTIVGTAALTADASIPADGVVLPQINQETYITPGAAAYFTLHHGYSLASPLRVQTPGNVTLRARDQFGNVAAGDPVNGNYYVSKIKMATNSKGTADLRDWLANTTDYVFVPADHGERQLLLQDTIVETLKVSVTDYHIPGIYGYTGDGARGMPAASSPDVVLSGLRITPLDMSPEDPLPVAKTNNGINKNAIYQGDGVIAVVPAPVPMLRLTMQTEPVGTPTAYLKSVQVKSSGTLNWADIVEVGMYADNPTFGQTGAFDGETSLGGAPVDIFMSSGTYDPGLMAWHFNDLQAKVSTAALVSNTPRNFFFTVRMSTVAATPRSFSLVMENPSYVVLDSTFVGVAYNNFPIATATSPVRNQPATIMIKGNDIAAWWQPSVGTTTLTLGQYTYVEQGQGRVGFLEIKAWTENFTGVLKAFKIIKTGTGSGADLKSVRLFLDSSGGDPTLGDGIFAPSIDKEVTDPVNPPSYDIQDPDTFVLPLINPGLDGAISISTRTYYVVYEFGPDSVPNMTHGARLENSGVNLIDGWVGAFQPVVSSTIPLYATADIVYLADVNKSQPNDFAKPSFVTQNDKDKAVVRLTMQINGSQGSAIWSGLKLDRWVTGAENGNTPAWNKVTDVKKISIWYDSTLDGLLETTGTVKDTEVLLIAPSVRTFPYDTLKAPLLATDTVLRVYDIQKFFPADSPFPMAPGRLIMNDGQADPSLKEVIYYSSVDVLSNAFGGLTRGAEATAIADWSTGTVVSGQAVLPMIGTGGALDGQVIYNVPKDYFVAYDIDPLANVSNFSYIGVALRSTDYFMITSPKHMSTVNVGVTAPGKTLSLVGKVREYADEVVVKATDTVLGPTLQQQAQNQPVMVFTIKTSVADAMWRWMMVYATGTVMQDGTAINDVSAVKVWHDADNNGFLGASDVMVGSGTFGNTIYGPLTARVDFASERRVVTDLEALNNSMSPRYFLTYDIRASAMPNDPLGNPRYLGAYLKADSLPQNSPATDDPAKNSLSLPNYFSAANSNLTYVSKVREIVSSPSTVTVLAASIFSPDNAGSAPSLRLAQDVASPGPVDAAWLVTSTAGIPASGYAVVDNEIISYAGTAAGALTAVTRGAFNTPVVNHANNSVIGGMVYQGWLNYPVMRMALTTSGYGVRWQGVRLSRKQPAGLAGYDEDAEVIKVWKDNGNGVFDRDAATGLNTSDTLIGTGRFGVNDPVGKATIAVKDPELNNQDYVVIRSTPTVIFVSVDIDKTSRFSNVLLSPQNDVLGIEVPFETNFLFGPENSGHVAQFLSPVVSQMNTLLPTMNNVTMTPEDISPVSVTQNDKNVGVLAMRLVTDKTSARVEAIRLSRRGTSNDSDIDLIKVWKDSNDNCILDSVDTASNSAGAYPYLASYGNESYSSSTVNIALKSPIIVTTNTACAFISYDMSQFAIIGSTAALSISSAANFTIGIPNVITLTTSPINTMPMLVREIPSNVVMGGNDVAGDLVLAGGVNQAQINAPMIRFNLITEAGNARWSAIKVQRTGASNDPAAPFGKNGDVKFIRIYQDSNQNDMLDVNDTNISEARSTLAIPFTSTDTLPFNLVLASTTGFPAEGRIYIGEAELASYSGSGVDAGTGKPYLRVFSRGEKLGDFNTPVVTHAARVAVRKVDVFDQENPLNTQTHIQLSQSQTLSPLPQTYFAVYDLGEMAIKANKVGLMIRDKSWIVVNAPHDISPNVFVGISKALPRGTYVDIYPFSSSLVPVKAVNVTVKSVNIAPKSAEKNTRNVPMMTFTMATLADYVMLGQIKFQQSGSISSTTVGFGDGDLAGVALWKDDGDGAFSPVGDKRLGFTLHSATNPFVDGVFISITDGNLPYMMISTAPTILHLACDISSAADLSGADIMGHLAGLTLGAFTDLRGVGGMPLAAGQHYADTYPMDSNQILISPAIIPLTPVYSPVMLASNGYPAYALLDSSGNVVMGAGNLPLADTSRWRTNYTASGCRADEPLIDINGDNIPDNFDYYGSGKCNNISLNNSGIPTFDIDGDRLLDFESNIDYVPDRIINDGTGKPLYFIGDNVQNVKLLLAVSELGAVPSVWASKTTELPAMWNPSSGLVTGYELSLGGSFADPTGIKNTWQSAGSALAGKVTNVALSPGHFTHLTSRIDVNTSSFSVVSAEGFAAEGVVYVGNEIMVVTKIDGTTFKINERGAQGSFRGPHTAWGETVSDRGYVLSVRGIMADGRYIPSESGVPIMIYRIDTTYPTTPGAPEPQVAKGVSSGQAYTLKWDSSADGESNVMSYEIQEREGTNPVWHTVAAIPGFKTGGAINNIYTIGDPVSPGETPRPFGKYYTYRVRSWNFAGLHSEWSAVSTPAGTTIGAELLSKVSNYPNPVDLRKGGVEGRTVINYTLNDNAEVTITLYDLLGYVVREFKFTSGADGGKLGPNFVIWDGRNGLGGYVSKGGYIVRVKAASPKGSKVIMRKVGVIH